MWWSSETPAAGAPLQAPRDLGEEEEGVQGAGMRERRTAGLCRRVVRDGGEGRGLPSSLRGLGTQGCKARAGGCVTIQQRSGRTTEPSGEGGGRGRGHRGEPPPPFAKAYN